MLAPGTQIVDALDAAHEKGGKQRIYRSSISMMTRFAFLRKRPRCA